MSMKIQHLFLLFSIPFHLFVLPHSISATPIGICYGRVANNLPPPSTIVNLLNNNGIKNVRIFDVDPATLKSFSGTEIYLMVGVPNEHLPALANGNVNNSVEWLQTNIFAHIPATQVKYIAVGNEVFLKDPYYANYVVPSILNLYQALQILNLGTNIKLSSPQAASVISTSFPPSAGAFDPDLQSVITPLLQYLSDSESPFMVNIYPYFSYLNNLRYVNLDYALSNGNNNYSMCDGGFCYNSLFDATVDAFAYAIEKQGFPGVRIVVTETGWPTAGGEATSVENALTFNQKVVNRAVNGVGTPKRPEEQLEVYLFDLFDEKGKDGKEYEKHFGIFELDGTKVYDLTFNS